MRTVSDYFNFGVEPAEIFRRIEPVLLLGSFINVTALRLFHTLLDAIPQRLHDIPAPPVSTRRKTRIGSMFRRFLWFRTTSSAFSKSHDAAKGRFTF
jgi:hypothetical protein